jgi:hypothetical protein
VTALRRADLPVQGVLRAVYYISKLKKGPMPNKRPVEPNKEVVVQIGFSIVLYMRSLFLVESFDLRPSNQYILVRVICSFRFAKTVCQ